VPKGHFLIIRDRDDVFYHLQHTHNEECGEDDTLTVDFKNGAVVALCVAMARRSKTIPQVNYLVERFDFDPEISGLFMWSSSNILAVLKCSFMKEVKSIFPWNRRSGMWR